MTIEPENAFPLYHSNEVGGFRNVLSHVRTRMRGLSDRIDALFMRATVDQADRPSILNASDVKIWAKKKDNTQFVRYFVWYSTQKPCPTIWSPCSPMNVLHTRCFPPIWHKISSYGLLEKRFNHRLRPTLRQPPPNHTAISCPRLLHPCAGLGLFPQLLLSNNGRYSHH